MQLAYTVREGLREVGEYFEGRRRGASGGMCVLISEDMAEVKEEIMRILTPQVENVVRIASARNAQVEGVREVKKN